MYFLSVETKMPFYVVYLASEGRFRRLPCLSNSVRILSVDVTTPWTSHACNYKELVTVLGKIGN